MTVYLTHSPEETRAFAETLGRLLLPGDVLCLTGELGAGKTTFTQGLALGLGLPPEEPVNSPTFTLLTEHPGGRVPLYHFDVYRLANASGLYELAFDEYLDAGGVVVIEWADKVRDALPSDHLDIALCEAENGSARRISLTPCGQRACALLRAIP